MSPTAVEVVERAYRHLDGREGAELLELLHPDITWVVPDILPFGGVHHGRDAAAAALAEIVELVFDWGTSVDDVMPFGPDRVVAIGRHPVATTEGLTVDVPFLAEWRVEEGRVTRFEEHLDTLLLLRATGRSALG